MGQNSQIEWTDATWNPVTGCDKVSEGCRFCYAKTLHDMRHKAYTGGTFPGAPKQYHEPFESVKCHPDRLRWPLSLRKPQRIFVNSMSDLFHKDVPDEFIDKVWGVMSVAPRHTFQILTKRPERMVELVPRLAARHKPPDGSRWPLPNVHVGVSVENQEQADKRIPFLLKTPSAVRFLSCEPLLSAIDLTHRPIELKDHPEFAERFIPPLNWVIVGGESGKGARPMHPDWARSIRDQCQAAGVSFFFKQWGEWAPWEPKYPAGDVIHLNIQGERSVYPWVTEPMSRVGSKKAGRLLHGREWNEMPAAAKEVNA